MTEVLNYQFFSKLNVTGFDFNMHIMLLNILSHVQPRTYTQKDRHNLYLYPTNKWEKCKL